MTIMKKRHALLSVLLALTLVINIFMAMTFAVEADTSDEESPQLNEQGLVENIEGGNILHCWCWNFNTIKENIPKIAEAGYSAVQTSPINEVKKGHNGGLQIYGSNGRWYWHYQPTNYTIGNYQLGTEAEFKSMCETAHSYGVKVIVDVVANHTTTYKNDVAAQLRNLSGGLYHTVGTNSDKRHNMTQTSLQALPDCNTQNKNYQNIILTYLKKCVSDGADGFRFDAAKHIELPEDDESYASDFWPTVLDNGATFQYGEVLQSAYDHFTDYAKIMHVTASTHGETLRNYFLNGCSKTGAATFIAFNSSGVKADRLVTWVESHDTYSNEEEALQMTSSFWMTNDEIRRGWALISARKGSTCLFFNRPKDSQPTTDEDLDGNPRWGANVIGDAGDDNWFHPDVVAVNKFRNAMLGVSDKVENINGQKQLIMVTRGSRGAVIINNSDDDVVIDKQPTTLADGTYKDVNTGVEFIAYGGYLYGNVKAKGIIVIYDDSSIYTPSVPEGYTTAPTEPTTEATQPTEATEPAQTKVSVKAAKSTIYVGGSTTVTATVTNKVGNTVYKSSNTGIATVSSSGKVTGKKAGTVTITAKNNGAQASVKIKVIKKNQSMTVKSAVKTVKYTKVKKSAQTVAPITVKNAKGSVKYSKASGSAKLTVNSKGKITVKKGTKKGTYTAVIKVTAAGNAQYNSCTKSVKVTVKVK